MQVALIAVERILNTFGVIAEIRFWLETACVGTCTHLTLMCRLVKFFACLVLLLEELIIVSCVNKADSSYASRNFVTITVPYPEPVEPTPHHDILSCKDVLTFSSHIRLGLPCRLTSGFPIITPNAFLICRKFPIRSSRLILLDLIGPIIIIFGDKNKLTHFSYPF